MEEQQCSTKVSTVVDTTYTEECVDVVEQVCTEAHVGTTTNILGHSAAGPFLGAIAGSRWKREADADADADADAQFFGGLAPADYAAASAGYAGGALGPVAPVAAAVGPDALGHAGP